MTGPQQFYSLNPEHDILYVTMNGTWNMDTTQAYISQYKKDVSRYFAREWAAVLDLRNLEMLLSEEFQLESIIALNTWSFIKGMTTMAIIVGEHNRGPLLYQFEEIFNQSPAFARDVFSNPVKARHWLFDQGFRGKEIVSQATIRAVSG